MRYGARVPKPKNVLGAKSSGKVSGSARKRDRASHKPFAVFDIDGTLIRWQLYHAVANRMAKSGLLGQGAYDKIKSARKKWKDRTHGEAFKDYEKEIVRSFSGALSGIDVKKFRQIADEITAEYSKQTYVYTRDLIKKLKKEGYLLVAISGSANDLVEAVAKKYGFDDWVGSHYEAKHGVFTGETEIVAMDKAKYLSDMIKKHGLSKNDSVGVGDTASDIPLLENVQTPIAFNPEYKLFRVAIRKKWKVVIERKNVIYELEPRDGQYILV